MPRRVHCHRHLRVVSGATLTILPGTTVRFNLTPILTIEEALVARGTAGQPITFTANKTTPAKGDWQSIQFSDSSVDASFDTGGNYTGGSIIQHVVIEYAGGQYGSNAAVKLDSAAPYLDQVTIRNNKGEGIYGSVRSELRITGSTFQNNDRSGVEVSSSFSDPPIVISGNIVTGNSDTGIIVSGKNVLVSGNIITQNTDGCCRAGGMEITVSYQGNGQISGNTISANASNSSSYAGGLRVSGNVRVSGNTINGNTIGGGIAVGSREPVINNNNIYDNTYRSYNSPPVPRNLTSNRDYSSPKPTIDARGNWWGATDVATIEAGIWDESDDTTYSPVDYAGYRSGPVSAVSGRVTSGDGHPVAGVTISAGAERTTTTDASGAYVLSGLDAGSYTLTPSQPCYSFASATLAVTVPPNVGSQNFTATQSCYSIAGRIADKDGKPLTDATVSAMAGDGGASLTAATDANGSFSFVLTTSQADPGNYLVTVRVKGSIRMANLAPAAPQASIQAGVSAQTGLALSFNAPDRPKESDDPAVVLPRGISRVLVYIPLVRRR